MIVQVKNRLPPQELQCHVGCGGSDSNFGDGLEHNSEETQETHDRHGVEDAAVTNRLEECRRHVKAEQDCHGNGESTLTWNHQQKIHGIFGGVGVWRASVFKVLRTGTEIDFQECSHEWPTSSSFTVVFPFTIYEHGIQITYW